MILLQEGKQSLLDVKETPMLQNPQRVVIKLLKRFLKFVVSSVIFPFFSSNCLSANFPSIRVIVVYFVTINF